jgi:hypothetical protein
MIHPPHYHNPLAVAMPPGFERARVSVKVTSENFADVMAVVTDMVHAGAEFIAPPIEALRDAVAAPKRTRKPGIGTLVKSAEKTGKTVTSITTPDGTTIHFDEGESAADNEVENWFSKQRRHADQR